jgi:glycosyltransferase involved in cell wall biosynthesis
MGAVNSATRWYVLTGEYPPAPGGVSDYTQQVAEALAARGEKITVCAPTDPRHAPEPERRNGVSVQWLPGHYGWRGLWTLSRFLAREPRAGRIFLQYVPQAFGWKGMNILLCLWLSLQSRHALWVMFHEVAYVPIAGQPWRHQLVARVNGWMARRLALSAQRILVSTLAWIPSLATICGRPVAARWAPVPSNFEHAVVTEKSVAVFRSSLFPPPEKGEVLIGHFGTFGRLITERLEAVLPAILEGFPGSRLLLLGRGSRQFASHLEQAFPAARNRVHAVGEMDGTAVGVALRACDLLLQCYPDGVSTRRTSAMGGLAVGCPVLTEDGPLTEPIWRESGVVNLIPENAPPSTWVQAIRMWMDTPLAERQLQTQAAQQIYRRHFSLEHTLSLLLDQPVAPDGETPTRVADVHRRSTGRRLQPASCTGVSHWGPQSTPDHRPVRVAIVADHLEEGWPSMDLVAEMLTASLRRSPFLANDSRPIEAELVRPPMRRRFSPPGRSHGHLYNLDRLLSRFHDYPTRLKRRWADFDLFHVVDHSYAHLVQALPPGRVIVTCHDVDAFRCVWTPPRAGMGWLLRAMARQTLSGLQQAAHVCCDSEATRGELRERDLLSSQHTSVVRLGLRPEFLLPPDPEAEERVRRLLADEVVLGTPPLIDILHVGSTIARKRIDVLLDVFSSLRRETGDRLRLLRVGGEFTPAQQDQSRRLGLTSDILVLPFLSPAELAGVYRRATLVLVPSDAEGFGLPVIEGLACGTSVLASDLPVMREVGGEAANYLPVADVAAWTARARTLLNERRDAPTSWEERRKRCRRQGTMFSWDDTARQTLAVYQQVLDQTTNQDGR